ncbi:PREDICTED: uncharacterized protein LOC107193790 [Dufourea novaeangliae]|uniref:Uncharacterized protein n=1 Tax=Dufourea novaeangliae TaxID=178035 RepID=A0A154NXZ7_DUFNO|nr:PREDICTED: uncharacterized protein LOC107193790 [Dufourea novaeangliae]KZC03898.1 hypothetical protein WN55_00078 [Dufourea novaeangliae]
MEPPKKNRIRRLLNASVMEPERQNASDAIRQTTVRHRLTMNSSDFVLPHNHLRNHATDRLSMLPQQFIEESADNEDVDLNLLYNEYLQNLMTEIILKKKKQKMEKLIVSQLATMAKEIDHNKEKLFELKTRERDIIHLTKLQNEIDSQIAEVKNCTKFESISKLKGILSQLYTLLRDHDVLRCDNVILPETPKEWEETLKVLKSSRDTLKSIMDLIGSENESYLGVNNGIKEFLNTYEHIKDLHKRLEKDILELQAYALKTAALSLMSSNKTEN